MKYVQLYLLKITQIQKFDLSYYYLKTKFDHKNLWLIFSQLYLGKVGIFTLAFLELDVERIICLLQTFYKTQFELVLL
jgi:hypothetical protein